MKRLLLSFALVMSFVFTAAFSHAEDGAQYPSGVAPIGMELGSHYGEAAAAEETGAAPPYEVTASSSFGCAAAEPCCDSCGDDCCDNCSHTRLRDLLPEGNDCFGWRLPCCSGEAEKLFNPCSDRWSLGGWINGGVTLNSHGVKNNGPIAFPSTDELMLNQLWFFAARKADTGGCGWDWGR